MKITKKRYLEGFGIVVVLLAALRCMYPSIAQPYSHKQLALADTDSVKRCAKADTAVKEKCLNHDAATSKPDSEAKDDNDEKKSIKNTTFFDSLGNPVKHRIYSVRCFKDAFPDMNDIQLVAAMKYGVQPVHSQQDAEGRKKELVYVGSNPFFYVDRLHSSIPYLIPRASALLQQIGRNFFDSLQVKGVPLHKIIVTSVMRSKEDVQRLRNHNGNATQNSCHLYGTTFDVCYNRYKTIEDPEGPARRKVRNDTLKWVLSEVLNDMRNSGKCYIKYEVNQGCFHITVK